MENYTVQKYKIYYVKEPNSKVDIDRRTITTKYNVKEAAQKYMKDVPFEMFCVYALDGRNKIIGFTVTDGDINQCTVYIKNVFRFLFSCGAASFIVAHNHPAGCTEPSNEDWIITIKLKEAGALLDLPLLDHIIISENEIIALGDMPRWTEKKQ